MLQITLLKQIKQKPKLLSIIPLQIGPSEDCFLSQTPPTQLVNKYNCPSSLFTLGYTDGGSSEIPHFRYLNFYTFHGN